MWEKINYLKLFQKFLDHSSAICIESESSAFVCCINCLDFEVNIPIKEEHYPKMLKWKMYRSPVRVVAEKLRY